MNGANKPMNPNTRRIIATMALLVTALAQTARAAEEGRLTVVGTGLMDVTVLRGDTPVFTLHNTLCGLDWKGARLEKLAEVKDGKTCVYEQDKVGRQGRQPNASCRSVSISPLPLVARISRRITSLPPLTL